MPGWSSNRPSDYFAVGVQSAKGTEAGTFFFPKHLTGSGFENKPETAQEREGGGGQEVGLVYKKVIKGDGNAVLNLRGVGAVYAIIDGVLGKTATTSGPVASTAGIGGDVPTGMQKARIVPAATLPYLTFEQRYSDEIERVSDSKVNQAVIEGGAGLPLKISAAISGAGTLYQRDIASALTPAYDTGDPIYFPQGSYVLNAATSAGATVGNTTGAKMTKFKVTAARHLDEGVQTTGLFRDDLIELTSDYNFDCTLKYEDRSLYQAVQFNGGSVVPIPVASISFTGYTTNGQPSGATQFRSITINMQNLLAQDAKVNKLEPDGKTVYIDLTCSTVKPAGATDSLIVDLIVPSNAYTNFG
jgi:hypothetical protein